jgi:transposase
VRSASIWGRLLGVENTVIERVEMELDERGREVVVATVRPSRGERERCPVCRRRCGRYDEGRGVRRWRTLDLGTVQAYVQAAAPRVACPEHGVLVAHVPWARHGAGHTRAFDEQTAWLALHASASAVQTLMRTTWRTVGKIAQRVWAETGGAADRFANLRRIGIDEISFLKGHRYIVVVLCHDTGRLIWAAEGRDSATVAKFFDALGPERAKLLTHVTADSAAWIDQVVAERAPQAARCADAFHIVAWATDALDEVRREAWNRARGGKGKATEESKALKNARWSLWKNPENLSDRQSSQLAWIAKTDPRLHRAYLLKEGLRTVFAAETPTLGIEALDRWISWARRCRIPAFVKLAKSITAQRDRIVNALVSGLSNARVESMNTKIRLIMRRAFGFHSADAIIGWALLNLGGYRPALPGRP